MAIREYVGARYVPRFMGTYNASQIYEALDVVDNGIGTSYIAKKTVPAGTALTNTEYWFVYGATSGAILNLQNQIDALDGRVDHLETLAGRYFLLVGDSLGKGYTPGVPSTDWKGWVYYTKQRIEAMGGQCYAASNHGGGFACANDWYTNLSTDSDLAAIKDQITDVVILGGTNDIGVNDVTYAMLTTGINTFFTWARSYFPNAEFKLGILTSVLVSVSNSASRTIQQYRAASKYGVAYLADLENLFSNLDYVSSDNVHLTQEGYAVLSPYVFDCIINGHTNYKFVTGTTDFSFAGKTAAYRFHYTQNSCLIEWLVKNSVGDLLQCDVNVTDESNFSESHSAGWVNFCTFPMHSPIKLENFYTLLSNQAGFFVVENGQRGYYLGELNYRILRSDDATSATIQVGLPVKIGDWGGSGTVLTNPTRWVCMRSSTLFS